MGTYITLSLGNLEVDWGKNFSFTDHSSLFQTSDLKQVRSRYFDESDPDQIYRKSQLVYVSKLGDIVPRLELQGYTLNTVEGLYYSAVKLGIVNKREMLPFKKFRDVLIQTNVEKLPLTYTDSDFDPGEFVLREIADQIKLPIGTGKRAFDISSTLENLDPWVVLSLLAQNPTNLDKLVVWDFSELIENGYVKKSAVVKNLDTDKKFLIITEGSSDTNILKKALGVLKPKIEDFFTFIDMENNYPFGGTGNLHNFSKGLAKIGVLNNILIIYDNDTEGVMKYLDGQRLDFPKNMKIAKLPDLEEFNKFKTIGPTGTSDENINGRAVSIELFLDHDWKSEGVEPMIRWTGFNQKTQQYQGEMIRKELYSKQFLELKSSEHKYNYAKLEKVIDCIYQHCVKISELEVIEG